MGGVAECRICSNNFIEKNNDKIFDTHLHDDPICFIMSREIYNSVAVEKGAEKHM